MQLLLAAAALLSLAAMVSAGCYSCYSSPCWQCSSYSPPSYTPSYSCNSCNTYTPYYQPTYYRGGGYGSSAASAAASSSSGYGGSSSSASASSSSGGGGGWGSSSAASSASSGFSSNYYPSVYYDVSPEDAAKVDTEEAACKVLVEQWADRPIAPQEIVNYIQETFFGKNVKRDFKKDVTPSTFQCCHAKFSNTAFKAGRALAPTVDVKGMKVKLDYTVPVLPKGQTCDTLTADLLKGLKSGGGSNDSKKNTKSNNTAKSKKGAQASSGNE